MQPCRVMVSSGTLPSAQIDNIAASHPFFEQIDVVFPSSAQLEQALSALETTYYKTQCALADLFAHASHTPTSAGSDVPPMKALPTRCDPDADGAWCIDPRGILTLCVAKTLYERLGLVGKKLPFKGRQHFHAVTIPLRQDTQSAAQRARQRTALETWDSGRAGLDKWEIAHVGGGPQGVLHDSQAVGVKPQTRRYTDVFLPLPDLAPPPASAEGDDDWKTGTSALFEWVGMVCLGAQRLAANDRVDPYVAVYDPPTPAQASPRIGGVTHMRWSGLLDDGFVRAVLAAASAAKDDDPDSKFFVAVTMHASCLTPVSYLPVSGDAPRDAALRMPRSDGEDTVCIVISGPRWLMAQSIRQWDARWG